MKKFLFKSVLVMVCVVFVVSLSSCSEKEKPVEEVKDTQFQELTIKGNPDFVMLTEDEAKRTFGESYDLNYVPELIAYQWVSYRTEFLSITCAKNYEESDTTETLLELNYEDEAFSESATKINGESMLEWYSEDNDTYMLTRTFIVGTETYEISIITYDKETAFKILDEFCSLVSW